ncbi:phage tail tube protein [Novosphingobium naphthalenivorans]|uniref:phage tail tube protein n=1 Tax=Novosphingobium naphthalenivorans TaxID=273168 RepID=UPI00082BE097|nr:phage tail tube protein [Novosphingobium naphthalenivorans]
MANKNKVVGQAKVVIDGTTYSTSGESTMDIGGPSREGVSGDYEAGAFKETTNPAKLDTSLLYKAGVSLSAIRSIDDATVILDTDIGTQWIMRNAYVADVISFGQDGKAKVVFQSDPAEEVL